MGRSRSRSPRKRSRSRERERIRDVEKRKERVVKSRSRSKERVRRDRERTRRDGRRSRSTSRTRERHRKKSSVEDKAVKIKTEPVSFDISADDLEGKTEEEVQMMKMMGFAGFNSTKGKHIEGNDISAVHQVVQRKYRQYMNRKGGFNRPLDYVN